MLFAEGVEAYMRQLLEAPGSPEGAERFSVLEKSRGLPSHL